MGFSPANLPQRILVTGGSGAVGSAVACRLAAERRVVRSISRHGWSGLPASVEQLQVDVADRAGMGRALEGMDAVVHCSAVGAPDLATCRRTNVDGVAILLEAMDSARCRRLVHISTVAVYDHRRGTAFDEESPLWTEPLDAYGFTKAEGERLVRAAERSGLAAVILRPVVVLSMHPTSHWGPRALDRARDSAGPLWPLAEMPFVDVENLVDAILLALTDPRAIGRAYNVVDGTAPTSEYLAAVSAAIGRPLEHPPPDAPRLVFSGERLRRELGYSPENRWKRFLEELRGHVEPGR